MSENTHSGAIPSQDLVGLGFFGLFFGCAESLLLCGLFSSCSEQGLHFSCRTQASHCSGFSYCGLLMAQTVKNLPTVQETRVLLFRSTGSRVLGFQ